MTNRFLITAALLPSMLIACGGGGGGGTVTPEGMHNHYVINKLDAPTGEQSDEIIRVDSNHKPVETGGQLVNALGGLLGTVATLGGGSGSSTVQTSLDTAVNNGSIILLADFQTADFMNTTAAGFQVFTGSNPMPAPCTGSADTVCGNHLKGTGSFDVTTNTDAPLAGDIINGKFDSGSGSLGIEFALSLGSGSAAPLMLNLEDAHVELTGISATGYMTGIIGGAISQDDINNMLIPTVATQFEAEVTTQCVPAAAPPGCGCPSGSGIATLLGVIFPNGDSCDITPAAIMNNATVMSLLQPDVAINSSTENALSVGIGMTAVAATYTVTGETD